MTILEANQQLVQQLQAVYESSEAANVADMLMEHITGFGRVDRLLNKASSLLQEQEDKLQQAISELLKHKPIQHILHEAWFAGIKFFVNEHALIPRPETEELVVEISNIQHPVSSILDIGSGSGCIPISVKKKLPNASVLSVDVSNEALIVAKQNATNLGADVQFMLMDFLDESNWQQLGMFDVIVSNPPYIKQSESSSMNQNVLAYEPHLALFVPDDDALLFYRKIALFGKGYLNKQGKIFVEINEALGNETVAMFKSYGYSTILKKDMQGKDRIVIASIN